MATWRIGDWKLAQRILHAAPADLNAALNKAVTAEGEFFVGKIKQYMRTGSFAELSPNTLAVRRSGYGGRGGRNGTKPLFRSGDLRNSITQIPAGNGDVFVGIPRAAKGKGGAGLVRIGEIHENGKTIVMRMTDKQRRFLHAVLPAFIGPKTATNSIGDGTGILVIHIPARPFIAPVFATWAPSSAGRMEARLGRLLGGKLGKVG